MIEKKETAQDCSCIAYIIALIYISRNASNSASRDPK